ALIALARLVERVEVHDEIELAVVAGRDPGECIGVVGARFVEDGQCLAVAGRHRRQAEGQRSEQRQCTSQSAVERESHDRSPFCNLERALDRCCGRTTECLPKQTYDSRKKWETHTSVGDVRS